MFSLIACIGKNRELGLEGRLIFHFKEDMRFFRETTSGRAVVMGRRTWESLPIRSADPSRAASRKLPGRENIVISRRPLADFEPIPPDRVISDLSAFIAENADSPEEIFIIGGGEIYREFLPFARYLYLTEVDASAQADTFFPEFDTDSYKREILKKGRENDLVFSIVKYAKK